MTPLVPRILVAPDKFKGSLSAAQVASSVRDGLLEVRPALDVSLLPVADGGEGTLEAAFAAGYERVPVTATGPTGQLVDTAFARSGAVALLEMADVSGLAQRPGGRPAARTATSRGAGEVLAAALDAGCRRVVLGVGGSACTDGGAGMLQALGVRLSDSQGRELPLGGAALARAATVDLAGLHPGLRDAEVVVACDVDNPLTGPEGAAAVYGPQKGASAQDVVELDAALARFADVVAASVGHDHRWTPGAGAAGGTAFAAVAVLGAQLRPGIDLVLDLVGFEAKLAGASLVVVGEGSLDVQSLRGKAVVGVASVARAAGVPVVAVCGRRELDAGQLRSGGLDAAYALTDLEPDPEVCMRDAEVLLRRLGGRLVGHLTG